MSKKSKIQPTSTLERTSEWLDFTYDAPVRVLAERFKGKHGYKWRFRARVVNADASFSWIEVYGGKSGYESLHAFREAEVKLIPEKTRRKRKSKSTS